MSVYDDQKNTTTLPGDDELRDITGISEPDEQDIDKNTESPASLSNAENSAVAGGNSDNSGDDEQDKLGSGYTGDAAKDGYDENGTPTNRKSFAAKTGRVLFGSRRRKILSGVMLTTAAAGIMTSTLLMLSPLKILHITNNLQDQFFGVGEAAMSRTTENLLSHYLVRQVMPGMLDGLCSTTRVDKTCAVTAKGTSPISQLYNAWRDARFETKLANKHGIELIKFGSGRDATFYLKTPSLDGKGVELGKYNKLVNYDGSIFAELDHKDRNKIRREIKLAFKDESLWKRMMYRYKVGKFVEKKYGVARCAFACTGKDKIRDTWGRTVTDRLQAGKGLFVQRVMNFNDEATALAFECGLTAFDCTNYDDPDLDGNRSTAYERDLRARIVALRATGASIPDLLKDSETIRKRGLTYHLIEKVSTPLIAKLTTKAIPIYGWVELLVTIKKGAQVAGPAVIYLSQERARGTMVEMFTMFRSLSHELKSGNVDLVALGSATQLLSSEGGYTAEQAPIYQTLNPSSASVAGIFNPSAYAADESPAILDEVCDVKPLPGDIICGNESLKGGPGTPTANGVIAISKGIDNPVVSNPLTQPLTDGLFAIFSAVNTFFGKGLDLLIKLTHLGWVQDFFIEKLKPMLATVIEYFNSNVFVSALAEKPNAINNYTLAAGGADVLANEYGIDTLGGQALSDSQAYAIRTEYLNEQKETFQQQSFFVRMFDTENSNSTISQLAMASPTLNVGSIQYYATAVVNNPTGVFGSIFSSFLGNKHTNAAVNLQEDPFGQEQNGYPSDHPVFTTDPDVYWKENDCGNPDQAADWTRKHSEIDPETRQVRLLEANGCKLLMSSITSAGGRYDESLIPPDDQGTEPENAIGSFKVGTFNLLGNQHTASGGKLEKWPSGTNRMKESYDILKNSGVEVVGFQELEKAQRAEFLRQSAADNGVWKLFPTNENYTNFASANSIAWDSSVFRYVEGGYQRNLDYLDGKRLDVPWVLLRHKETNEEIYIKNTHDPVDKRNSDYRIANAKKHISDGLARITEGKRVVIVGDFNSNTIVRPDYDGKKFARNDLTYCIMTDGNQEIQNALDTAKDITGHCKTKTNNGIDHIYHSNSNLKATSWSSIDDLDRLKISDHDLVFSDISILGSVAGSNSGNTSKDGWQWPIKDAQASDISNGWGDRASKGIHKAIDIPKPNGTPVYAAHDGEVVESYWNSACGYFYLIKAAGTPYWSSYQHLQNLSSNKRIGDTVTAGERIGKVGKYCGSGYHLHFGVETTPAISFYASPLSNSIDPLKVLP